MNFIWLLIDLNVSVSNIRVCFGSSDLWLLNVFIYIYGHWSIKGRRGAVRIARLTRYVEVVGLSPIKGPCCFLEQETLPLLLSTGWFQEWIRVWFHNLVLKAKGSQFIPNRTASLSPLYTFNAFDCERLVCCTDVEV